MKNIILFIIFMSLSVLVLADDYNYTKSPVDCESLDYEIEDNGTIDNTLLGNTFLDPDQLTVSFDGTLDPTEESTLDTIVSNHTATPLNEYYLWCYPEKKTYIVKAPSFPSTYSGCGSDIENVTSLVQDVFVPKFLQENIDGNFDTGGADIVNVGSLTHQGTQDIVQLIIIASATQTNDLAQFQDNSHNPMTRITNEGNIVLGVNNVTTNASQFYVANTTTPGNTDMLIGLNIDYTGVNLTNGPTLYGIYAALPGTYGAGTEATASFNGDGRTAIMCSDWEGLYVSDGAKYFRACTWNASFQADGLGILNNNMQMNVNTDDVSNPPTDAQLDAIFGAVNDGFTGYIDDNGAGTNFYQVVFRNSAWYIFESTKAL